MNNNDFVVSIIVPVYGTEAYLSKCIESILSQTYSNIQLILVDDGSADRCPEICDEYAGKDSRITVIHQENKGVSGARNTGIHHATGEFIMFVDSDDELLPQSIDILLDDALEYDADIASGAVTTTDFNEKTYNVTIYKDEKAILLALRGNAIASFAYAKLYKASFIRNIYFEEGKKISEDIFFVFQCFTKKPVLVHRDVALYKYNVRAGSASRQSFSDSYLSMLYFMEKEKEIILQTYPQYASDVYNMEVRTCLYMLDVLCKTSDKAYKDIQNNCISTVRHLRKYHRPVNDHHKVLEKIVSLGLYTVYKFAIRLKYYRKLKSDAEIEK